MLQNSLVDIPEALPGEAFVRAIIVFAQVLIFLDIFYYLVDEVVENTPDVPKRGGNCCNTKLP